MELTDREWLDVTIIATYVDRGNVIQQEIQVVRSVAEEEMTQARNAGLPEEAHQKYVMSNQEFQARVLRAVQTKLSTPIQVKSQVTNEVRLLPPSAYREVIIRVNNLGKVLEA